MSLLLTVVEAGSLSAAARQSGLPLTTVSRRMADLESHLNARLLTRTNRRIELTEAGQSYAAAARRILDQVSEAERTAAGEYTTIRGDLVITAPLVFGRLHVLPVVTAFLQAYPQVHIRLTLADRVLHLTDDHLDVAIRIGALPDSSLIAIRLGSIRRVTCASPAYLAARGIPQAPADLAAHDCISFSGLSQPDRWSFGPADIALRPRLTVNTAEAAIDAATAGLGLTRVLSYQIAPALAAGSLTILLQDHEPAPVPVSLLYADQTQMPQKLRAFLDFTTPRLRAAVTGQPSASNPANPSR